MRRRHFSAFAPICPRCARDGAGTHPLRLAAVFLETGTGEIRQGVLHCSNTPCQLEFPIIDGIPIIVPDPGALLAERAIELLTRDDLDPTLESQFGDALGPNGWFDVQRQTLSSYGWDGWADLDPAEAPAEPGAPVPGAARRCLARLEALAPAGPASLVLDLGCAAGRTSFDLAAGHPEALVLGIDVSAAALRLAQGALAGRVSYPRRRIGLVYDRRAFPVSLPQAERVDFWLCDATALPFTPGGAGLAVALNLLDCVPEPRRLLASLAAALASGGRALLACPYDWATRATPLETWIGGHSQRGPFGGAAEPFLRALLTPGAHPQAVAGLRILAEDAAFPWQTRLHDRASVSYRTHLVALGRDG